MLVWFLRPQADVLGTPPSGCAVTPLAEAPSGRSLISCQVRPERAEAKGETALRSPSCQAFRVWFSGLRRGLVPCVTMEASEDHPGPDAHGQRHSLAWSPTASGAPAQADPPPPRPPHPARLQGALWAGELVL